MYDREFVIKMFPGTPDEHDLHMIEIRSDDLGKKGKNKIKTNVYLDYDGKYPILTIK